MRVVLEKLVIKILAGIEMTWWKNKPEKKRKSNSSAHIIIQEQCYVLLCFNKKSDIFSAKYKNFAPNWVQ